jgi:hypothetical protein
LSLHILNLWTNHPHYISTYCSMHLNQIQSPWTYRQHDLPKHWGKHPTWHKKPEDCRHWSNTLGVHLETYEWEVLYKFGVYKGTVWFRELVITLIVVTPVYSKHKVTMWTHRQFLSIWLYACLIRDDTKRI